MPEKLGGPGDYKRLETDREQTAAADVNSTGWFTNLDEKYQKK